MWRRFYLVGFAFCGCVLSGLTTPAEAGREVLVDVGDNYALDGQKWLGDTDYSPASNTGTVPFALNFGSGSASHQFRFDPRGQILFLDGGGLPTADFLAPLLALTPFKLQDPFSSFMRFGAGLVDPQLLAPAVPSPVYNISNALQAYRFTWSQVCPTTGACDGSDNATFQAVLINRGGGDFDLDFNYGFGNVIPAGSVSGYLLGANAVSFTGPFTSPGPDYCFRGGVGNLCGRAVSVPEPATIPLFTGGLLLLAGLRFRRRGFASTAPAGSAP